MSNVVATIHARNVPNRDQRDWVTGPELVTEANIIYRQADYWTRTGLLQPITDITPGSGHLRRYPETQVQRAQAIRQLLDAGVSITGIRHIIDDFVTHGEATHAGITFHLNTTSTGAPTS